MLLLIQYTKFELKPSNILFIFVTEEVSKYLKSKNIKLLQFLNIESILLTEEVLKFLKSNDIKLLQPSNI